MATHLLSWDETPPADCRGGAVAIGNFDGVHRGHQALVHELRARAQQVGGPAVALTFDPHPFQLLRPDVPSAALTTPDDRSALLHEHGADHILVLRTSWDLLHLSAVEFFERVVRAGLAVRAMVEGDNFGFGRDREGDVDTLATLCARAGIGLTVVPPLLTDDGTPVSSSRVRAALGRGDVRAARTLLGRPYRLRGRVGVGQRRGSSIGFPTANLERVATAVPRDGVYAVQVDYGGEAWPGAANVGTNPTFGEKVHKIEVHLIGFRGDLYGQDLAVDFIERLRDTRPFAGAAALTEQLRLDVDQARRLAGQEG